jgi:hypothetical protein
MAAKSATKSFSPIGCIITHHALQLPGKCQKIKHISHVTSGAHCHTVTLQKTPNSRSQVSKNGRTLATRCCMGPKFTKPLSMPRSTLTLKFYICHQPPSKHATTTMPAAPAGPAPTNKTSTNATWCPTLTCHCKKPREHERKLSWDPFVSEPPHPLFSLMPP